MYIVSLVACYGNSLVKNSNEITFGTIEINTIIIDTILYYLFNYILRIIIIEITLLYCENIILLY